MLWDGRFPVTRREAALLIGGAAAAALCPLRSCAADKNSVVMLLRPIPSSGEKIPAVGLGSSRTFDVGPSPNDR
ncbi:MAG: aldo/keto reductase, partial [Chthoniobacterales bacterium]